MSSPFSFHPARLANRLLAGATDIRQGEGPAVLASGLLFFLVLAAVMVLRPVRESFGLEEGTEAVRILFLYTVAATLLLVPAFGYLVSRFRRGVFLAISYRCCWLILLGFYLLFGWAPEHVGRLFGEVYYVYHSVFNLFVVSLFWALMADLFDISQSKRLFPAIAIGGTLGAIVGSLIPWKLADTIGVPQLFLVAIVLLEAAAWAALLAAWTRGQRRTAPAAARPIGGHPLAAITAMFRSPYMLGIALVAVLGSVISTFFYFTELRLVEAAALSKEDRTALFASINYWTQAGTLVAQAIVAGRIMRVVGVGVALAALPLAAGSGFLVLVASPTLGTYRIVRTACQAVRYGITRPARETLFTVLPREDKYKAKSLLDTLAPRAGDASGAQLEKALGNSAWGLSALATAAVPLAALSAGVCLLLGRTQSRLAGRNPKRPT